MTNEQIERFANSLYPNAGNPATAQNAVREHIAPLVDDVLREERIKWKREAREEEHRNMES